MLWQGVPGAWAGQGRLGDVFEDVTAELRSEEDGERSPSRSIDL